MFYRAKGKAVCADVIPFYENGEFRLFYLCDYRNEEKEGEGCPWCLLTTKDLVHYHDWGPVLLRGNKEEQDLYVFTGCCVKFKGEYMIFYTGHNPHLRAQGKPEQKILRAVSKDMIHWKKDKHFVLEAPPWLEMHDFRDPFVFYDEENKRYCMLIAGRLKNKDPIDSKGVTLVAFSSDLTQWEVSRLPFYAPHAYFTHECPDLFKMGDWWYLVFSEFTDKVVTTYRMSRSPYGPWITPKVNNFDGHAFYAAKSVWDGRRRILFGWNCIKQGERDNAPWQWGGTIIPHEIVQAKDGTLYVRCPDEVRNSYSLSCQIADGFRMGDICEKDGEYTMSGEGKCVQMFGEMPKNCKIELFFRTEDDRGDFGVILRESDDLGKYYVVRFEPKFNRMAFDKFPREENTRHIQIDVERYCPIAIGEENKLTLIAEDSVLEVYVNDRVAMSTRMFDFRRGNFGVYTHNIGVAFRNISIFRSGEKENL